jgi:hypothetical protein
LTRLTVPDHDSGEILQHRCIAPERVHGHDHDRDDEPDPSPAHGEAAAGHPTAILDL